MKILYVDFGESVGAGAGNVRSRRVEGDVHDALVKLLTVRRYLLHTDLVVEVPETDGTVVRTCINTSFFFTFPKQFRN